MALPARILTPPWPLATLLLPAHPHAIDRAHALGHAGAHSLTLPLPRRGPSSRSAPVTGSQGSATEAGPVGVAQTPPRGSARPPGASRRLPCSPHSMSEQPRSRRSACRAPPRRSALRPRPPAQSPPRASAPPSREPVPGVTDHLTATCALRHVGSGGGAGQGRGRSAQTGEELAGKGTPRLCKQLRAGGVCSSTPSL